MSSRVAVLLLLVVAPAACGGHGAPVRARVTAGHGDGIRYLVPVGWHVARERLTPHLANPRELLTVGTGRLPAGGPCAQNPSAALAAMRRRDVLVTVQERYGWPGGLPPRPRRVSLPPATANEAATCAGKPLAVHMLEFRDGGRGFDALVAVGRAAAAARVRAALGILDSLRIAPRPPVRLDPNDVRPDAIHGLHVVLPLDWRIYRGALTRAVPARRQLALGTFRLHQRHPDRNCTPSTALRARPPGGAFVFAYETHGAPAPRPARAAYGQFECFGRAWAVRLGRFSAYVYGPPRRRREALAILGSIR